jgi:hypothetical protein
MNGPAVQSAYYLISAPAAKVASPASFVAPASSVTTLDDSGWRPARD